MSLFVGKPLKSVSIDGIQILSCSLYERSVMGDALIGILMNNVTKDINVTNCVISNLTVYVEAVK